MNLVIVESPAKAKTIEKYLGSDYKVLASFGHVRDLPTKKLGVDVKKNFEPDYIIPAKARKTITILKEALSKTKNLYLATDYDREGEAIAWHVVQSLGLNEIKNQKSKIKDTIDIKRITFTEITKPAITEAIKHPRQIDMDLVDAQQARRVLDRLVGYKLSPFLWRKIAAGLSAGRVQSVALRLIVERERGIEKFKSEEYWNIEAELKNKEKKPFKAVLTEKEGQKIGKMDIKTEKEASDIVDNLKNPTYEVGLVTQEQKKRYPSPPFTTSTLQQEAARKLGFSTKQTMRVAQDLYEDGLITYMRTDSINISPIAAKSAANVITKEFGEKYALSSPRFFKTKTRGAQEAHEAIRPTEPGHIPAKISQDRNQSRLYQLIWRRFMASQMPEAQILETNAKIRAGNYGFTATGSRIVFDGFLRVYNFGEISARSHGIDEENGFGQKLPKLAKGEKLSLEKLEKLQHFTEPPPRYSEGTLVKELEKRGIGRPSTYAPTISTIQERGYVEKIESKLKPLDIGLRVNDILVEHFPEIVDYDFTAKMEENLDDIAEGKTKWQPVIKEFYEPFEKHLEIKMETVAKNNIVEETQEKCPDCGQNLIIKIGRFGQFYACPSFPKCKFTKPYLDEVKQKQQEKIEQEIKNEKCPKCGQNLVLKEARFGPFLACSGYPECKFTKNIEISSKMPCPNCGAKLLQKRTRKGKIFWGCSAYPKCQTAFWAEPTAEKCPKCGSMMVKEKNGKLKCSACK